MQVVQVIHGAMKRYNPKGGCRVLSIYKIEKVRLVARSDEESHSQSILLSAVFDAFSDVRWEHRKLNPLSL